MIEFFKKRKKIIIPIAVILVAVALFLIFRPGGGEQIGQFQTATIERGDLTATVGATGTVRARQTATLVWQTTGTVEKVNVQIGDQVKAEDVIASLSKTSLSQNLILAEADLVSAQQAMKDLLESDTARAQAWIALRAAEDAFGFHESNRVTNSADVRRLAQAWARLLRTRLDEFGAPKE